jgi:hypothetical protein
MQQQLNLFVTQLFGRKQVSARHVESPEALSFRQDSNHVRRVQPTQEMRERYAPQQSTHARPHINSKQTSKEGGI